MREWDDYVEISTDFAIGLGGLIVGAIAIALAWIIHRRDTRKMEEMSELERDNQALLHDLGPPLLGIEEQLAKLEGPHPVRRPLPEDRRAITHHFVVGGHDGYVTVGLYPDGRPGEVFFRIAEAGSTVNGLMDTIGLSMSMALQHGVPLKALVRKLVNLRFEPEGTTNNSQIRFAKSVPDYVGRWLAIEFLSRGEIEEIGLAPLEARGMSDKVPPTCDVCGGPMKSTAGALECRVCGSRRISS